MVYEYIWCTVASLFCWETLSNTKPETPRAVPSSHPLEALRCREVKENWILLQRCRIPLPAYLAVSSKNWIIGKQKNNLNMGMKPFYLVIIQNGEKKLCSYSWIYVFCNEWTQGGSPSCFRWVAIDISIHAINQIHQLWLSPFPCSQRAWKLRVVGLLIKACKVCPVSKPSKILIS